MLTLQRKKRIAVAMTAVPVLLGVAFLGTYVVVQSSSFKGYLSKSLSGILGERVDIGQDIQISSIFPRLSVVLPNVKMRPTSLGSDVERARIDSLTMSVSPGVVFSGGERGHVDIHVKQVTLLSALSQVVASTADGVTESDTESGVDIELSIAQSFASWLQRLSSLDIAFTTEQFVYLVRDAKTGSERHEITDLSLTVKDQAMQLSALVAVQDEPLRSVNAEYTSSTDISEFNGNDKSLRGELSAEVSLAIIDDSAESQASLKDEPTHTFSTPVELSGNQVNLSSIEYRSPIGWLRGSLGIDMGAHRPQLVADLEVRKLQLSLIGNKYGQPDGRSESRLFPFKPFAFRIPEHIDAQVDMHLGAVRLDATPIINGNVQISLIEGKVELRTKNLTMLGGKSELSIDVTTPTHGFVSVKMKLEADNAQLNRIRSPNTGEAMISKGKADVIMALKGSGPSPGHIAASSSGYILAAADSAEINQKYSTLIDQGVVKWGLDRISILARKSESDEALSRLSDPLSVLCASVKLHLNDGRAEVSNGVIIELPQNTLYSSGYINFYNEKMGFALRAKKKSLFEWSAISIARFAEISGTLAKPSVTLNKNELAKQGILSTSSIMWGPLPSLVYTLAESGVNNSQSKKCRKSIE